MLTIGIKIHSLLIFPAITDWNYHQLRRINEKTDDYSFVQDGENENGRANYYRMFGRYYYSFLISSAYFIILDDVNEKGLDPWQMDWLEDELKKGFDYKYRFVFMHVPLYDPRKGG